MKYYPVCLDIQNRNCLVVGGGVVGTRKVMTLLDCGAKVTVVGPVVDVRLQELAASHALILKNRPFRFSDLSGMFLVCVATDDQQLNRQIHARAEELGMLCNVADRPEVCNFILPSIVNRGDLTIAVSTAGQSPAFAKKLRQDLEKVFGNEYAEFLKLMGAVRKKLLSRDQRPEAHKHLFEQLINDDLVTMIKKHQYADIDALLFKILGKGYEFESLMNE